MTLFSSCLRAAALPLALACAFGARAQSATLSETVITATRTATRADELVSDVRVVDRAQVEAASARSLPELLARTVGVQMSSNGGRGKLGNVFIRGAENRHTILLVDGVRVGSATAGIPIWETIPVELIERIEVLKGPASALYGSDGVAGVVQVFTRRGRQGYHPHASLTAGSHRHWLAATGVQGGGAGLRYAVGVQRLRERGFNTTNEDVPFGQFNPDVDPFRQDAVQASLDWDLAPGWRFDAGMLHSDGRSWFDDGPGVDAQSVLRALTAHAGLAGRLAPSWRTALRFSLGEDTANTVEAVFPGAFRTRQAEWRWQNDIDTPLGVVLAGLERREQRVRATTAYDVTRRTIDAAFAGLTGSAGAHSWQLNLRRDRNSQFGHADTWFAGYGLRIAPAWRVHASHGTSFVAPSFNQLYFPGFGNPQLQPERGRNTDLGLTWTRGAHEVKLVRFDNRIRGFMTNETQPQNVPRARIDGFSLGYAGRVGDFALRADFERLDPRNEVTGAQLPRRARRQVLLGADWAGGAWRLGGSVLHAGSSFDDADNTVRLGGYTTVDLHADWRIAPAWTLQARVNNLFDRDYHTAAGYNQPGRSLYLTLRWQPQ